MSATASSTATLSATTSRILRFRWGSTTISDYRKEAAWDNPRVTDDRVLLITGASSGIGAATARAAAGSYRLVLAARRLGGLGAVAAELGGEERAIAVRCDVTEWDEVQALAARALERFGRIDAVFANAGFGATRGFLEESPEHWRSMVLTDVYGVALTIRATLPHLLERGDG